MLSVVSGIVVTDASLYVGKEYSFAVKTVKWDIDIGLSGSGKSVAYYTAIQGPQAGGSKTAVQPPGHQ